MENFDFKSHIENSSSILNNDGSWPSFCDAAVYSVNFWRGDMRPDDDVYIGPVIETSIELTTNENLFVVDFKFHDCDSIEMSYFNHDNFIEDVNFGIEERGFYTDGKTPLPPYISVNIGAPGTMYLKFKCFKAEVTGRREITGPPYA